MWVAKHTLTVTTDASGDATSYTPAFRGRVLNIVYTKVDFAAGVDFAITLEDSGINVWTEVDVNASKTVAPRQPTHGQDGTASLYAGTGEPVEDGIFVPHERVKIVVSNGGDTKTGTFDVIYGG